MRTRDGIRMSVRNLKKRKGRTILTALGVSIGTAAIVCMVALGIGLQRTATESLGDFGDLSILQVHPNWENVPGGRVDEFSQPKIRQGDIDALEQLSGVQAVMPSVGFYGMAEVQLGRQWNQPNITGLDFSKADAFGYTLGEGSMADGSPREVLVSYHFPSSFYEKTRSRPSRTDDVVDPGMHMEMSVGNGMDRIPVVGRNITVTLEQYLGEGEVRRKNYQFRIAGVMADGSGDWGNVLYVPLDVVQEMRVWQGDEKAAGGRQAPETGYDSVRIKVAGNDQVTEVVEGVRGLGLQTWSPTDMLEELNRFFLMVQLILGGIGSVALLVATIGIINTMIMAILERNREIGVMKVLGATLPNVKFLFLTEAAIIGLLGGLWGLLSSLVLVRVINLVGRSVIPGAEANTSLAIIPPWLVLFALSFSILIGLLAGLYPAARAARISPMEAIRNE